MLGNDGWVTRWTRGRWAEVNWVYTHAEVNWVYIYIRAHVFVCKSMNIQLYNIRYTHLHAGIHMHMKHAQIHGQIDSNVVWHTVDTACRQMPIYIEIILKKYAMHLSSMSEIPETNINPTINLFLSFFYYPPVAVQTAPSSDNALFRKAVIFPVSLWSRW